MKRKVMKSIICSLLIVALLSVSVTAFASSNVSILKVNGNNVRLRSTGNMARTISYLNKGNKVLYGGKMIGKMCLVMTSSGKVGYVYKPYLSKYGAAGSNQIYLTKGKTTVYKVSGSSLKKVGTVKGNTPVVIYDLYGNWALVRGVNGKSGVVKLSSLIKA